MGLGLGVDEVDCRLGGLDLRIEELAGWEETGYY